MSSKIIEAIGLPAFLEQMAEEASELSQASLKFARKVRGENPTPKDSEEIYANLIEEMADVYVCINELMKFDMTLFNSVRAIVIYKEQRWKKRLEEKDADN